LIGKSENLPRKAQKARKKKNITKIGFIHLLNSHHETSFVNPHPVIGAGLSCKDIATNVNYLVTSRYGLN